MADVEQDPPIAEEEESLAQVHRLLGQLQDASAAEAVWELGFHVDALS